MPYYIRYQGRKQGPLSDAQMVTLLTRGTISKDTDTSLDEENWQPLGSLPDFEKLYTKVVERQLKASSAPPIIGSPVAGSKTNDDDIFAIAGFSHDEFIAKIDTIQRQTPVLTPPTTVPEKNVSGFFENPKIVYGIGGGLLGLILLVSLIFVIMFGNASPVNRAARLAQEQEQKEAEEKAAAEKAEQERKEAEEKAVAEKTEQERKEAEENAAIERIEQNRKDAEEKAAAVKAEQERKEAEKKAADEKRQRDGSMNVEFIKAINLLNENFPLQPVILNVNGNVQRPESVDPKFAALWTHKEFFSLQYISYAPVMCFSGKNISPHEIVVSYEQDDIFRFFLDENGLHGQWLDAPSMTSKSYRKLNGIIIGELDIVLVSHNLTVKSVSLFTPVERATFRPALRQVVLPDLKCDLNALGFSEDKISILDAKGYRTRYDWKTLAPDMLQFCADGNVDIIRINLVPQQLVSNQNEEWKLPIEVKEIQRDSSLLQRYITDTKISQENLDAKIKEGTNAVNRARSDMLDLRHQFNRNDSNAEKALLAIGVLNRQLSMANSSGSRTGAASIRSQILYQESIFENCLSANNKIEPQLYKLEHVYDTYYGRLKVLREYKILLDKPKMIYQGEPMTFIVAIKHPTITEKQLTLLSIKEPDMVNEKDAVIPDPIDDDKDKTDIDNRERRR
jgi:hypothetical protein